MAMLTKEQKRQAFKDFVRNKYELTCYSVEKKSKFALVVPGGGYFLTCVGIEGLPTVKALNEKGYTAFVLRYRCREKGRYPFPQDDLACAIKTILDNAEMYNVEKEGYSVWGYSAGGHLTASMGTDNMGYKKYNLPKPALLVLSYPVIDMGEFAHRGSADNLLGKNPTQEQIDFCSVQRHVTEDYPATYVWCCEGDDAVPDVNTKMMDEQLTKHNIKHTARVFPDVESGHGIVLGEDTAAYGWFDEAIKFWEEATK